MKPYILSQQAQRDLKKDWAQEGNNITYKLQNYRYSFLYEEEDLGKQPYCLSFDYEFQFDNDTVYFAFCVPYTFTNLIKFLKESIKSHNSQNKDFITEEKLCQTMSGIDVPLLTVTDNKDLRIPYKDRKIILVSARIHPGESNGSWMMHGLLQFLFGDSEQAIKIRKNTIFKIIPMLNPDGVIMGNYRTGFAGRDLNRVFHSGDKVLYPTIVSMKELTLELKRTYGKNFNIFIDLHGHSVKKNVFVYGPEYPIYDLNYYKCRILPKLMGELTDMFRYYSSTFKISPGKKNTGRAVLFSQYDIQLSYTVEASNGSFNRNGFSKFFTSEYLNEMGMVIGHSLHKYVTSIIEYEAAQLKKVQQQQHKEQHQNTEINTILSDDETLIIKEQQKKQNQGFLVDDKIVEEQKEETKENQKKMKKKDKKNEKKKKKNKKQDEINLNPEQIKGLPFSNLFNLESNDIDAKPLRQDESDNFSEGGSDSESSDEDYDKTHLKEMQKNISTNRDMLKNIFQDRKKQKSNSQVTSITSKRNSRKGRQLLNSSKDNKNLSDSKTRNNSLSTDTKEQKIPEKKGIYVSKVVHIRPLTAIQFKKVGSSTKIDEEQGDLTQLKEYNSNRPQTVGMKKRGDQRTNQNSKKNLSQGGQQLNSNRDQMAGQTESKNALKPPISAKSTTNKTWMLMMKNIQDQEQQKQKQDQYVNQSRDEFQEDREKGMFSNFQAELEKQNNRLPKQNESQQSFNKFKEYKINQQEDNDIKNLNNLLSHTPNTLIEQDQYFKKFKSDTFKPKSNCPPAFYAMKKHINLKKKVIVNQK